MFEVENLSVFRGSSAIVQGLTFSIESGQIVGLLGPNGAGKTTAICGLLGLLPSTSDRLVLNGTNLCEQPVERRARLGYVPQAVAVYPELSVTENLRIWSGLYGLGKERASSRITAALELAGLTGRKDDRVKALSGGMQRRLNLAIGLLHDPDVLICDEPTTGVDAESRRAIYGALEEMKKAGKHVLYTTHYFQEVEDLCDRVVIIQDGAMILNDRLDVLLAEDCVSDAGLQVQTTLEPEALESALRNANIPFSQVSRPQPSLEQVFLKHTSSGGEPS